MSATSADGSMSRSSTSTRTGTESGRSDDTGSYYASGGSGSTSGASGASGTDPATPLSRGAVTNRTAPTQRVGSAQSAAGTASSGSSGSSAAAATGARTGRGARQHKGPSRVRLGVARVDPWSVIKISFLLSVAIGIAGVVLTAVLWMILSTMNVFTDVEGVLQSLQTTTSDPFSIKDYVGFGRVVSLSIVIGVIDVILMTAIATVMAFLYNICSALVGGVQLTLTDD